MGLQHIILENLADLRRAPIGEAEYARVEGTYMASISVILNPPSSINVGISRLILHPPAMRPKRH